MANKKSNNILIPTQKDWLEEFRMAREESHDIMTPTQKDCFEKLKPALAMCKLEVVFEDYYDEDFSGCDHFNQVIFEDSYDEDLFGRDHDELLGKTARGKCPFCRHMAEYALVVSLKTFGFSCFCGGTTVAAWDNEHDAMHSVRFGKYNQGKIVGSLLDYHASIKAGFWIRAKPEDVDPILEHLATIASVSLPKVCNSKRTMVKTKEAIVQSFCELGVKVLWSDQGIAARGYLMNELGLTEKDISERELGLCPSQNDVKKHLLTPQYVDSKEHMLVKKAVSKDLEGCIIIPWKDNYGRPIKVSGHYPATHPNKKPKTIEIVTLDVHETRQTPFGLTRALKVLAPKLVAVEDPLEAILLQAKGETNVIAFGVTQVALKELFTLATQRNVSVTLCAYKVIDIDFLVSSLEFRGISSYVAPVLPDGLTPSEFVSREGVEAWHKHLESSEIGAIWSAERLVSKWARTIIETYTWTEGKPLTDSDREAIWDEAKALMDLCNLHQPLPPALGIQLGIPYRMPSEAQTYFWDLISNGVGSDFAAQRRKLGTLITLPLERLHKQ